MAEWILTTQQPLDVSQRSEVADGGWKWASSLERYVVVARPGKVVCRRAG